MKSQKQGKNYAKKAGTPRQLSGGRGTGSGERPGERAGRVTKELHSKEYFSLYLPWVGGQERQRLEHRGVEQPLEVVQVQGGPDEAEEDPGYC